MTDLSQKIANLSPEKKAALMARLKGRAGHKTKRPDVDYSGNFVFRFKSDAPFDFAATPVEIADPDDFYIQVEARASSLNFRDVMIASGMYPASPNIPSNMGSDYAGTVVKVGSKVTNFSVGDEVIVLFIGHTENAKVQENCHFIKKFNVFEGCAFPKPKNLTFEQAACIPTVFLTAYLGLVRYGHLKKEENLLVHMATGGVGLAALEIGASIGANIFATAGTQLKRDYLASRGISHVFDSRSADFADIIAEGGYEMDVVLNSLSGDLMSSSMELLRPFGRFIHIDKKDVAANSPLPMGQFIKGISFRFLDISLLMTNATKLGRAFSELCQKFESGAYRPIDHKVFEVNDLKTAITELSRGTHIGKLVVRY
jgi:NADPH:quinone reductase-like Zn-dependent oxidoreductase